MNFFAIHIFVKDLAYLIIFWALLKYNITHETYLSGTISDYPGAPKATFSEIVFYSLIMSIIPILVSFVIYIPIVLLVDKIFKRVSYFSLLTAGFLLSVTTPIIYILNSGDHIVIHADESTKNTKIIAFVITFIISIGLYFLLNKNKINQRSILINSIIEQK